MSKKFWKNFKKLLTDVKTRDTIKHVADAGDCEEVKGVLLKLDNELQKLTKKV
jgi:hypothetical protein